MAELGQRAFVDGEDAAFAADRDQRLMQKADEFGTAVETQDPRVRELAQEMAARDEVRRHVDQRHRVTLDHARVVAVDGGCVEHAEQAAVRVDDRRARTRHGEVVAHEMLVAMNRHGAAFGDAGAKAVGAFVGFIPKRAVPQTGVAEFALECRIGDRRKDRRVGIGKDHRVAGARDLVVQTFHLGARDAEQFAELLLALAQLIGFEHGRGARAVRFHAVFGKATVPGFGHVRGDRRPLLTAYRADDAGRVPHDYRGVAHE